MTATLETRIESVLVFPEGAEVTRVCEITADSTRLEIPELPLGLLDDSLRVALVDAPENMSATQLTVALQVTGAREKSELAQKIREAALEQRRIQENLSAEQHLYESLSKQPVIARPANRMGVAPPQQQLKRQLELQDFRSKQLDKLSIRIGEFKKELREAAKALGELQRQQTKSAREVEPDELRKVVKVQLNESASEEQVILRLTYLVEGARWAPAYSARFSEDGKDMKFAMRAVVCQATDEDWSGVKMSLSTALPNTIRECPEFKSRRIGRAQSDGLKSRWVPPPSGTEALFEGFDAVEIMDEVRLEKNCVAPPPPPPTPAAAPQPMPTRPKPGLRPKRDQVFGARLGGRKSEPAPMRDKDELGDDCFVDDSWVDEESGWLGESAGSAAPVPLAAAAPGGMSMSAVPMKKRKAGRGGTGSLARQRETTVFSSDHKLWRFGQLRLLHWRHSQRGQLVHQESWELYLETLELSHHVITSALNMTALSVSQVLERALPNGISRPTSVAGFDHLYQTGGLVDVPADGQFHSLPVFQETLPCTTQYVVVPRASTHVFRSARVENITVHGLCPGPVDVSLGEDFLHTTPLSRVEPSAEFDVGLGVCQGIKVSRETKFKESSSGLMSQTTSLPHEVRVQVVNNLSGPVELQIRERLPEVDEAYKSDLKVEAENEGWKPFKEETVPHLASGLQKTVSLPAGESITTKLSYTLSMPAKYEIIGGNRRETNA